MRLDRIWGRSGGWLSILFGLVCCVCNSGSVLAPVASKMFALRVCHRLDALISQNDLDKAVSLWSKLNIFPLTERHWDGSRAIRTQQAANRIGNQSSDNSRFVWFIPNPVERASFSLCFSFTLCLTTAGTYISTLLS